MIKVAPSILSADFSRLGAEVEDIRLGGADYVHFDVMDGCFVPNISIGIPVLKTCAVKKAGLDELKQTVLNICEKPSFSQDEMNTDTFLLNNALLLSKKSKEICDKCVSYRNNTKRSGRLDKILTSKSTGIPIMLALFALLFWITAVGANYPSEWLSALFAFIKERLYELSDCIHVSEFLSGILIDGVYTTLSWVVSVMLPPMAIFFPLFSIIEDSGYLPRIAFNLDKFFSRCGANGKQSLSMCLASDWRYLSLFCR